MRIVFLGTSELGIPALKALEADETHSIKVVTKPDRIAGRGRKRIPTPLKETALELGLEVNEPEDVNAPDFLQWVKENETDVLVVASFGEKLSDDLLDLPRFGGVNIHPSLLPRYRGASPVQYALLNGDEITGVSIFQIREKMDAGEILGQVREMVMPEDDYLSLHERLSEAAAPLMCDVLKAMEAGTLVPQTQDDSLAVKAPSIRKEQGRIDWSLPAEKIVCRVRAFSHWPGAFTFYVHKSRRVRLLILKAEADASNPDAPSSRPGELLAIGESIMVACGAGTKLYILSLQREGKKAMSVVEFLRGMPLAPGSIFESE
ncbi:MAG: methionyl-tRNA formyltransferase [Planctomycetes bacterium]|nr:methionyl-tRNA formyltransferase [Planctomycetota bacterium]